MTAIRASDAKSWVHCPRRAWFDRHPPDGYESIEPAEFDQLMIALGGRHEWNVKRQLEQQHTVAWRRSRQSTLSH